MSDLYKTNYQPYSKAWDEVQDLVDLGALVKVKHDYLRLLEVAITRGSSLGYADDDYRQLWREITGKDWLEADDG